MFGNFEHVIGSAPLTTVASICNVIVYTPIALMGAVVAGIVSVVTLLNVNVTVTASTPSA